MIIIYIQLALMSVTLLFVLAAATLGKDAGNGLCREMFLRSPKKLTGFSVRQTA